MPVGKGKLGPSRVMRKGTEASTCARRSVFKAFSGKVTSFDTKSCMFDEVVEPLHRLHCNREVEGDCVLDV